MIQNSADLSVPVDPDADVTVSTPPVGVIAAPRFDTSTKTLVPAGQYRPGDLVDYLIDGTVAAYPNGSNPEGVAVDAAGNVYGAVVSGGGAFVRSSR